MFKNYLVVMLRNIIRNKIFFFINVIGLAAGIASFVKHEFSFESVHKNADNIHWLDIAYDRGEQSFAINWTQTPLAPE